MLLLTLFSTLKKPIYCCRQRIPIRNSNLKLNMEKARKFMLFLLEIQYYFYYVHPQVLLSFYLYTKDWYGLFNIFFIILFISYTFTYAFLSNFIYYYYFSSKSSLRLQLILLITFFFTSLLLFYFTLQGYFSRCQELLFKSLP